VANNIEFNLTNASNDATTNVALEIEKAEYILISGTMTTGTITLNAKYKRGWAPLDGGIFTKPGLYKIDVGGFTSFQVVASGLNVGADLWVEIN